MQLFFFISCHHELQYKYLHYFYTILFLSWTTTCHCLKIRINNEWPLRMCMLPHSPQISFVLEIILLCFLAYLNQKILHRVRISKSSSSSLCPYRRICRNPISSYKALSQLDSCHPIMWHPIMLSWVSRMCVAARRLLWVKGTGMLCGWGVVVKRHHEEKKHVCDMERERERGGKSASVTTQRIVLVFILLGTSGGKDYTRVCRWNLNCH